jgi:flagellar protein FliS
MRTNPYNSYFDNEILSADAVKLVVLIYRGALDAVGAARRHLAAGDIRARSLSITKATELVAELIRTLDYEKGGEISPNLARVYDFVLTCLNDANSKQIDRPLVQAENLLATLLDGWQSQQRPVAEPTRSTDYAPAASSYEMSSVEHERFSYAY